MQKLISIIFTCFIVLQTSGQTKHTVSIYIQFQNNLSVYDRTITNNASGIGAGIQIFLNTKTKLKPTLEITGDVFGGTKELYLTGDGKPIYGKDGVYNFFVGASYAFSKNFYTALSVGPSLLDKDPYFTVKPSAGFYFFKNQRCTAKISFINIFQRDEISNQSFGYLSFSAGIKLF